VFNQISVEYLSSHSRAAYPYPREAAILSDLADRFSHYLLARSEIHWITLKSTPLTGLLSHTIFSIKRGRTGRRNLHTRPDSQLLAVLPSCGFLMKKYSLINENQPTWISSSFKIVPSHEFLRPDGKTAGQSAFPLLDHYYYFPNASANLAEISINDQFFMIIPTISRNQERIHRCWVTRRKMGKMNSIAFDPFNETRFNCRRPGDMNTLCTMAFTQV